jgi:hypothetical protein
MAGAGQQVVTSRWRAASRSCFSSMVISCSYNCDRQLRILQVHAHFATRIQITMPFNETQLLPHN